MHLISYAGYEGPRRTVPLLKPVTRHERKWSRMIDPATRTQAAMEEFNRSGLAAFRERGMPYAYREIVRQVAAAHHVNVMLVASASRMRIAVRARNEAMYRIKAHQPRLSTPTLGMWFARDHTSILHCIASHQDYTGLPKLVGYDLDRARQRNAEVAALRRSKAVLHGPKAGEQT